MRSLTTTSVLAGLLLGACAAREDAALPEAPAAEAPTSGSRLGPAAAPDLAAVRERAPLAFRASAGGLLAGGDETYRAEVDAREARVRPRHDEDGPGPGAPREGAPLALRTVSLARTGAAELAAAAAAPTVDALGTARRALAGGVAEELANTEAGLEQRWRFAARPAGRGDLRVRVAATGHDFVSADDAGLHFVDPVSGLGLVYGHATFIDARGARTALPAVFDGVHIVIDVPARVVDAAAYPAVLDPIVSGELAVGVPIPGSRFPATQSEPAVECHDSMCLAAWTDDRFAGSDGTSVFATRFDESGAIQDPAGIFVSEARGEKDPDVASDGTDFYVVTNGQNGNAVRLYKVSGASGAVVGSTSVDAFSARQPALAAGNGRVLVTWTDVDNAGSNDDVSMRLYSSGLGAITSRTVLAGETGHQGAPAVTYLPGKQAFYVVWESNESGNYDIYARPVTTSGVATNLRRAASTAAGDQRNPDVASAGGAIAQIVWEDRRNGTDSDIWANRGSLEPLTHTMLHGQGYLVRGESGAGKHDVNPSIGFSRYTRHFLVAWQQNYGGYAVMGERLNATGNHAATASVFLGGGRQHGRPAVAGFGPNNFFNHLVVYGDGSARMRAARTYTWGGFWVYDAPGLALGVQGNAQTTPSVASDGTRFLAVWADYRNPNDRSDGDIYGALVDIDAAGVMTIVGGELPIATGGASAHLPDVAFDGTNYVVVWKDSRGLYNGSIYHARVTPAGQVLDPGGVAVPGTLDFDLRPAVAAGGGYWGVIWPSISQTNGATRVTGAFYQGTTLIGQINRAVPQDYNTQVELATDESGSYLALYTTTASPGQRQLRSFVVGGALNEQIVATPLFLGDINAPQLAFGNGAYQAIYSLCSVGTGEDCPSGHADLGMRRISATGTPTGDVYALGTAHAESQPTIAFAGARFQNAWIDRSAPASYGEDGITGRALGVDGTLSAPPEAWIPSWGQGRHRTPRLACRASDGVCLLAYERFADEGVERVKLRSVRP